MAAQVRSEADQRRIDARKWIAAAGYMPKDEDWEPFCEALIDNHRDNQGVFHTPSPSPSPPPTPGGGPGVRQRPKHVLFGTDPSKLAPAMGDSWKHVRYLPAWMDPNYKEEVVNTPAGVRKRNTAGTRDALYNLRPALRLSDTIRNPTEYALRYGIAEDRLDGRSRMSPTWSPTRDPFDDFANQVNQLNDDERQEAEELSRQRYQQMNQAPVPGREILPEVMERLLTQHGLLSNAEIVAEVKNAVKGGASLDEVVYNLERRNPGIRKAHQVFLDNALDDQDYQRSLLNGLTTDELVQHNIQPMTDDVVMDLDNPIHPLFDRNYWDGRDWKGRAAEYPREVYSINGTREEWNVPQNDALWEALQPALRLVSLVLSERPAILEALMDMATRQPLPTSEDGRKNPVTPTLQKYVLQEDVDLSKTYPALRTLEEVHKYDWAANVQRVLADTLVLDIESAYTLGEEEKEEGIQHDGHGHFCYGSAALDSGGQIRIRLAGDKIWPLLVPEYSASEKMISSFSIASTLLHEFAHAVISAQELLMTEDWAQPPGQDPEITRLLFSLNDEFLGGEQATEPYFGDSGDSEVGFDLEIWLWGYTAGIPGGEYLYPRFYNGLMTSLGLQTGSSFNTIRLKAPKPMMCFLRPLPLDYVGKLFRKSFWAEEFEAYGFAALKMRPDGPPQLNVSKYANESDTWYDLLQYGDYGSNFVRAVPRILSESRHRVLAGYLEALKLEIVRRGQREAWWRTETKTWQKPVLHPLQHSINVFKDAYAAAAALHSVRKAADQMPFYRQWQAANRDQPKSFDEWREDKEREWQDAFRYGGSLMRKLLAVHNEMQDDLGNLQRMVFHYLSIKEPGAEITIADRSPTNYVTRKLYARLGAMNRAAESILAVIIETAAEPSLADIRDKWVQWQTRFTSSMLEYRETLLTFAHGCKAISGAFDLPRKVQFKRMPSGDWKPVSERWKKMAQRDYNRAHPEVRKTIDAVLNKFQNIKPIRLPAPVEIEQVEDAVRSLQSINQRLSEGPNPIFEFVPPRSSGGGTSGVPRELGKRRRRPSPLGDSPLRRVSTQRTAAATRVQKPPKSDAQQKSAFQSYMTNLLTTPDLATATKTAEALFASGAPQPVLDRLPGGTPAPLGGSARSVTPFINPFATRVVMTSHAVAFRERQEIARRAAQAADAAKGAYTTDSMWRTTRHGSDSDEGGGGGL
ncbi:hypothetical protein F4825DRAFT_451465 [Nemania diffusa]|nr:hypothetical protein F4825DRAFT_451465 [Nemania diffusa]